MIHRNCAHSVFGSIQQRMKMNFPIWTFYTPKLSQALFVLFCLTFSTNIFGQKSRFVSLELGGSGGIASLNYEKEIWEREVLDLSLRFGFSFVPIDRNNGTVFIFPIMIHGIFGHSAHKFDTGIGQTLSFTSKGALFFRAPLSLGYRFQPIGRRYFFRVAYTPIVSYLVDFQWEHWAGLTFGLRIKGK